MECLHGHGELEIDYRQDGKIIWKCRNPDCFHTEETDDPEELLPDPCDNISDYE